MPALEASKALVQILTVLRDTVRDAGDQGAPAGLMYAALMGHMSLDTFNQLMQMLIDSNAVIKRGHVYYAVK